MSAKYFLKRSAKLQNCSPIGTLFAAANASFFLSMKTCVFSIFFLSLTSLFSQVNDSIYPIKGKKFFYYVDGSSKPITEEKFTLARPFQDGIAVASDKSKSSLFDPLLGLINYSGEWITQVEFEKIGEFHEGVARARRKGKWGLIGSDGKVNMPLTFDDLDEANEGLIGVRKDLKWGYSDYFGNLILSPRFDAVTPFEQGRALVKLGSRWIVIDKLGKQATKGDWDFAEKFSEGVAAVKYSGGMWNFIDTSGQRVIPIAFKDVKPFKEGRAAVLVDGYWGFIDHSGKEVVPTVYFKVDDFSEGYAAVQYKGKWGYVDRYGKVIVRAIYSQAEPFKHGLARVKDSNGRYHYLNNKGLIVQSDY
jgi:hypothetical protein